jgi:hypothetical protein
MKPHTNDVPPPAEEIASDFESVANLHLIPLPGTINLPPRIPANGRPFSRREVHSRLGEPAIVDYGHYETEFRDGRSIRHFVPKIRAVHEVAVNSDGSPAEEFVEAFLFVTPQTFHRWLHAPNAADPEDMNYLRQIRALANTDKTAVWLDWMTLGDDLGVYL